LVKSTLPGGETDGDGHNTAADDPAAQKPLAGQITLDTLVAHTLPAGHGASDVEPCGQKVPPDDEHSWMLKGVGQNEPAGHLDSTVEFAGQ
jgi:hypothetical protein